MTEGSTEEVAASLPRQDKVAPLRAETGSRRREALPQTLRDSEARYRIIAESTYDWEYWRGPDGRMLYVSPSCKRITGYGPDEFVNDPDLIDRIVHPDDQALMAEHRHRVDDGGTRMPIDFRIICRDGTERWIGHHCHAVRDESGGNLGTRASNRDITARKQTERALRESRGDLNRAQAVAHIGSWRLNIRRNELLWSDETYRIFGIPKETPLTYETFLSVVHPDDRQAVHDGWTAALRGAPYDIEHRIVADKTVKWVHERAELEFDQEGTLLGGFGTVQDITAGKQAAEELREAHARLQAQTEDLRQSEQRLRTALEGGRMGLWEWDIRSDQSLWDDRVCELLGADRKAETTGHGFFERVHPLDRQRLRTCIEEALATTGDFEVEFRVVRPDETVAWLMSGGKVVRDARGRDIRVLSVLSDVTQRKDMEAELRRLNERLAEEVRAQTKELRAAVDRLHKEVARRRLAEDNLQERSRLLEGFFRHTITPLAFMDHDFNFVQVNDAYAKVDDKEPDDFVGRNHFALYPDAENQAIFEEVVRTRRPYYAPARPFAYAEHPERGVSYWNWQLTPLLDDAGQVRFLVLNLQDVTERQEAVCELEKRTSQLQRLTVELSEAEDRERRRLAELLHDELQQLLVGSKLRLSILARKIKDLPEAGEIVAEATDLIAESIQTSRGLSHELSPPVLRHGEMVEVLQWLVEQIYVTCGLNVRLRVGADVDLPSQTLKTFLYKAVREMLFNVVKHADIGRAAILVQRQGQSIRLVVSDKGRGFDPTCLDGGGQDAFGLFTIHERAQFLGGSLTVRSVPGRGSRFILTIPLTVPGETALCRADAPILSTSVAPVRQVVMDPPVTMRQFRILLVDDHKVMRDGLAALLDEESDIEVVGQAGNGRDAIALTARLKPDVVVMDVVMPSINGDEATRQIKTRWPHVRVIALSMLEEDATRERMLKAGAEAFLSKAGPSEALAAAIRRSP